MLLVRLDQLLLRLVDKQLIYTFSFDSHSMIGFVSSGTHSVLLKPMGVVNSVAFHFIEIGLVFSVPLLV